MYTSRTRLCKEVIEKVKEHFAKDQVFDTVIRKNVKLSESPSHGKPIISYAPSSHGSEDYMSLAKEVVQQENSKKINLLKNISCKSVGRKYGKGKCAWA